MTTAIKERPILFNGPLVRAILDGRKTQTRRVVKHGSSATQPIRIGPHPFSAGEYLIERWKKTDREFTNFGRTDCIMCPFGSDGDRLWVRESIKPKQSAYGLGVAYVATDTFCLRGPGRVDLVNPSPGITRHVEGAKWPSEWQQRTRPPMHMPRWASRITLEITGVRVQRLHNITQSDAIAEGIESVPDNFGNGPAYCD